MGERRIAGLAGGESLFGVTPRARYLPLMGMACGQCQWSRYGSDEVGAWGGPRLALMGTSTVNSAVYPEVPKRAVEGMI